MLTVDDLQAIRDMLYKEVPGIVRAVVSPEFHAVHAHLGLLDQQLTSVEGKVETLENDATAMYYMLADHTKYLRGINKDMSLIARHTGVSRKHPLDI